MQDCIIEKEKLLFSGSLPVNQNKMVFPISNDGKQQEIKVEEEDDSDISTYSSKFITSKNLSKLKTGVIVQILNQFVVLKRSNDEYNKLTEKTWFNQKFINWDNDHYARFLQICLFTMNIDEIDENTAEQSILKEKYAKEYDMGLFLYHLHKDNKTSLLERYLIPILKYTYSPHKEIYNNPFDRYNNNNAEPSEKDMMNLFRRISNTFNSLCKKARDMSNGDYDEKKQLYESIIRDNKTLLSKGFPDIPNVLVSMLKIYIDTRLLSTVSCYDKLVTQSNQSDNNRVTDITETQLCETINEKLKVTNK